MFFKSLQFKAYPVYLLMTAIYSFGFTTIATMNIVYQAEMVKLNALELVLVGTMLETICFISQVPTGIIADAYSRRLSVVVGYFLMAAGFLCEGLIPNFAAILVAQVLWGIGATCIDGAQEAWIIDEVGEEQAGKIFIRGSQVGQIAGLVAIPVSVGLANLRLNYPVVVGAVTLLLLAIFLLLVMPENHFQPTPREDRNGWQVMAHQVRQAGKTVRWNPMLICILGATLCMGLSGEGFDRLSQPHLLQDFTFPHLWALTPITWLGIISAAGSLLCIGATGLVNRFVDTNQRRGLIKVLFALYAAMIVSMLGFALAPNLYLAALAVLLIGIIRTITRPLYNTWMVQNTAPQMRATIFSTAGLVDAFGQIAGGPGVGYIGTIFSLRAALTTASLLLSPAIIFLTRALGLRQQAVAESETPLVEVEVE